jgi:PAS domain S-box-containing protein
MLKDPPASAVKLAKVEIRILTGFLLAMALLLLGGGYTYRTSVRFADSVAWVVHTQEVRSTLANVYSALTGAELALRDYTLNGQPGHYEEYQRLIKLLQTRVAALNQLTVDNATQQQNVIRLKAVIDARIEDMAGVMAAYQKSGLAAARALTPPGQQHDSTRDVGIITDDMNSIEVRLLADREAATERDRYSTLIWLLVTLAVAATLFIVLFRSIHREMRARRDAENALRASDQYNRSIIESSPDCVAILSADARILQMTSHGLHLLGIEDFSSVENTDWLETWSGEDQAAAQSAVAAARHGAAGRFHGFRTQGGLPKWWDVIVMPIRGADGRTERLLAVARDITERKQAEEAIRNLNSELRDKAAQLEAANKELESFSYSVSHDLRAPLRAIDGFALMIEEDSGERLDAEGKRHLAVIRENSRRMGSLIDNLLVFSRLGRQPVASRDVNVESIVREVVDETVGSATTPQIEVGLLPLARGDRGLLRQVWVNLIANAVKYSSKATRPLIQITGIRAGAENHYSVRDNGVGFDMAYADKLFGVFQRLHRADEFAGTGVGLAIVHRIVTRHGGRVWAEGKVNQGAVFSFALPNGDRDE